MRNNILRKLFEQPKPRLVKSHDYRVTKEGNLYKIEAIIERTPNMVIVRGRKAA